MSLSISPGEYVAVLGHNGSGKSTLARHLNALLLPTQGKVFVKDWDTQDLAHTLDIRNSKSYASDPGLAALVGVMGLPYGVPRLNLGQAR